MAIQRDAKQSIADSISRIIKFNYKEVAEDQIILARVVTVYSDILDPDTFGTMDCYDEVNKIEVPDVPLNAHINDDETVGVSGKYTFPKVGSDVYLSLDIGVNRDVFIPILFSHVDKVYESYNTEKVTKVVEVDTPDPSKPYDTEPTGNESEVKQTPIEHQVDIKDENDNGSQTRHTAEQITHYATDGIDTSSVIQKKDSYSIDTGSGVAEQTAVGAELLKDKVSDLIDIFTAVASISIPATSAAGTPSVGSMSPASATQFVTWLTSFIIDVQVSGITLK
jgi:hypothetical protein